ncbi:hypothetical protein B0H11DRAFT_2242852 [Mycena galericulata]|nr:hypothetical protein B0H11DRAFT_2242852 [Mycena galericulata]
MSHDSLKGNQKRFQVFLNRDALFIKLYALCGRASHQRHRPIARSSSRLTLRHPLRHTLKRTSALVVLIEELVPDTELSSQDPAETHDHQRGDVVGKFREAIVGLAALKMLHVSEGAGMWTFAQLLEMLRGWPQLEKLILTPLLLLRLPRRRRRRRAPSPPSPRAPSVAVLWIEPHPEDAPVLPTALLDGVRAWAPTLEALYLLAGAEPHLPVLPSLTALTPLRARARLDPRLPPRSAAVTALTLRLPLRACRGACGAPASYSASYPTATPTPTPDSPLHGENTEASSKATAPIPALPAPNLRTLTIVLAVPGPALPARADVGKGKGGVCVRSGAAQVADWEAESLEVEAEGWRHRRSCRR